MENIVIEIDNGKKKEFPKGTTYKKIVESFGYGKEIFGVKIQNQYIELRSKAKSSDKISLVDISDLAGYRAYKSTLMFIFEVALKEIFPELDIIYQHSVPRGILGEIEGNINITQEDLEKIKLAMDRIVKKDVIINKFIISKKDAMKFYEQKGFLEKAANIQSISDKVVSLYEINGIYNYFYCDMPYSTGSIDKYDLVYLGRNRVIFVLPTKEGELPEYVHYDNIINSFLEGKTWLETLKMDYVSSLNKTICEGKIKDFLISTELMFNFTISKMVSKILSKGGVKFILISGPSSSGKTTTTERISSYLRANGLDPIKISLDDFFLNREDTPKDESGNYDFESIDAIDLELFNNTIKDLMSGKEIDMPIFNFISGKREYDNNLVKLEENSIILIEGLHALNDKILSSINNEIKYKIYLSPFLPLNVDKQNYISTIDLRLIRRIIRDNRTRGYDVNHTIHSWQKVRKGEEKYIFPFIHQADYILNTAMAFEIGVEKVYIEPLLRSISIESIYYEEAIRLLNFLKMFYPIPSEYVREDSIVREFIGG